MSSSGTVRAQRRTQRCSHVCMGLARLRNHAPHFDEFMRDTFVDLQRHVNARHAQHVCVLHTLIHERVKLSQTDKSRCDAFYIGCQQGRKATVFTVCAAAHIVVKKPLNACPLQHQPVGITKVRIGVLVRTGAAFAPASAADGADTPAVDSTGSYLQRMDSDGDGRVSVDEYQAWMGYAFSRMDADGDGVLSAQELPGGRGRPITLAAHREQIAQRFARQDLDKDGYLSARELAAPPQ